MSLRQKLEEGFETALFASRWFMAPFYAGLAIALIVLMITFAKEVVAETANLAHLDETAVVVWVLSLIDMSLAANLTLMVMFAGYENFVSKLDLEHNPDKPTWLGRVDFSNMKLKLVASIIAISVIHLLKAFMAINTVNKADLQWLIGIHVTFLVSGVMLAFMDWLGERGVLHHGEHE
ncbi:MAG: TIGR00645 family protein [Rhizomicrobium sp.]